jgi:cytochrome c5
MDRIRSFVVATIVFAFVLTALAGSKGNEAKGKYYFKQNCKTCHTKGAPGGEVTPLSKNMEQWRAYFAKGKHNHSKEELTKVMASDQLMDAQTFLVAHASDSLQPETCGK